VAELKEGEARHGGFCSTAEIGRRCMVGSDSMRRRVVGGHLTALIE
jgi:hypothetical protein